MIRPLISCIILSYRRFEHIYQTIQSVLDQDYPHIEIGIFDDGSELFPEEDIKNYIQAHKGENIQKTIIRTNPKNVGTVMNFNDALQRTKGAYILVIPADDAFHDKTSCSKIVNFFLKEKAKIVTSYREISDSEGNFLSVIPSKRAAKRIIEASPHEQFKMIAMGLPIAGAGTYYSRDVLEHFNGFDEEYVLQEDGPMFLKATREGFRIYFLPIVTFHYRMGEGVSSGKSNNSLLVRDVKKMYEKEIKPYIDWFSIWEKRRIRYGEERIDLDKELSRKEKIKFIIKYPDVIIYRLLYSR